MELTILSSGSNSMNFNFVDKKSLTTFSSNPCNPNLKQHETSKETQLTYSPPIDVWIWFTKITSMGIHVVTKSSSFNNT